MNAWRKIALGACLAGLLLAVGCSGGTATTTEPATPPATEQTPNLAGTAWKCYEFKVAGAPQTISDDVTITAEFGEDGTLSGSSGVNTYSTKYTVDGTTIKIDSAIISTKMAGPEDAMRLESDYLTTLPTAESYEIKNDELILFGPAQSTIARYRPVP